MEKKEIISYLDTVSNVIIALTLFLFPLFFLTTTTDFFALPKQLLLIASTLILLVIWGLKTIFEKKIVINANPINLPAAIFGVVILVSAILSPNRYDALQQTVPAIAAIFFFFLIINSINKKSSFSLVLTSYVIGGAAASILAVAYYFKLYFLPIPAIQNQFFNTFGSNLQLLIYLLPILVFSLFHVGKRIGFPKFKLNEGADLGFFVQAVTGVAVFAGVVLLVYQMVATQSKPILLPYVTGLGIAFATISQDAQRFIFSLLFGSGYGTFLVDFTRFKLPSFNLEPNIWNLAFSYSSSYFLELIATTGILGALSYVFIIISTLKTRAQKNPLFAAVFILLVLSIILPFSFPTVVALFALLAIYVAYLNIEGDRRVYDIVLSLVANKRGILTFDATPEDAPGRKSESPALSALVFIFILLLTLFTGFFTLKFTLADKAFAESLVAAQQNNGQKTYELQTKAINEFPYRSDYHRIFSQINIALANSLAAGIPQGSSPSAEVQQNITALIQQGINSGRNAVTLAPLTSVNWQNLSQVYRGLIGVGQNAEQFSISSANQAIALDPYNPNLYVQLGGIYYQLKLWDQAINQFQIAINLKRDFVNAYYNLGHALEEKGDLENALAAYKIVAQLTKNNKQNTDQINKEIKALEAKIGQQKPANDEQAIEPTDEDQTPLTVDKPETTLPTGQPPIKISPPPAGPAGASPSAN